CSINSRIENDVFQQLWEYFTQFGKVVRVRVSRSLKTGNFKGWAYVGFADKEVAEIAAETMNGYLMFEKRLSCRVRSNFHLIASCLIF
ncbi:unnamed protein product, partial [Angiostrongylus costaricensis]|uniref:RRM domain-containing protein n=1 Tax=Angiostrongylus costaricensis TaxID=334426 RepID=A0A0R3PMI9_ANGCS